MVSEWCAQHPQNKSAFLEWLKSALLQMSVPETKEATVEDLISQLDKLATSHREGILSLINLTQNAPQLVPIVLECAKHQPIRLKRFCEIEKSKNPKEELEVLASVVKEHPELVSDLYTFRRAKKKFPASFFFERKEYSEEEWSYLLEKYAGEASHLFDFDSLTEDLGNFIALERRENASFLYQLAKPLDSIYGEHKKKLLKALLDDREFLKDFIRVFANKDLSWSFEDHFSEDPEKCKKLLSLMSTGHDYYACTRDSDLIERIMTIAERYPHERKAIHQLFTLLDNRQKKLGKKLMSMVEAEGIEQVSRILDMAGVGSPEDIEEFLNFVDSTHNASLAAKMLQIADSQHIGIIHTLQNLNLEYHSSLVKAITQDTTPGSLSPLLKNLLVFSSWGEKDLLKAFEKNLFEGQRNPTLSALHPHLKAGNLEYVRVNWKRPPEDILSVKELQSAIQLDSDQIRTTRLSEILTVWNARLEETAAPMPISEEKVVKPKVAALSIADVLLVPEGPISIAGIRTLRASEDYKKLNIEPYIKQHIDRILDYFEKETDLTIRLGNARMPPAGSRAARLIRQELRLPPDKPLTKRDVQLVILSGLLTPTRQSKVGSCFATNLIIQLESNPEGIRQLEEDLLNLTATGTLRRSEQKEIPVVRNYPMFINDLLTETVFEDDHLLKRALEFTVSGIGRVDTKVINETKYALRDATKTFLDNLSSTKNLPDDVLEQMRKSKFVTRNKILAAVCAPVFLASRRSPVPPNNLGAWILSRTDTQELVQTAEQWQKLLGDLFEKYVQQLVNEFPDCSIAILKASNAPNGVKESLQTEQFLERYLHGVVKEGLPAIHPLRYQEVAKTLPWMQYKGGGFTQNIWPIYFQRAKGMQRNNFNFYDYSQCLRQCLRSVETMPRSVLQKAHGESNFKIYMGFPRHAFSMLPAPLMRHLASDKSVDKIVDEFIQKARQWRKTPLTESLRTKSLDSISEILDTPWLQEALKAENLKQATTIGEFGKILETNLRKSGVTNTYELKRSINMCVRKVLAEEGIGFEPMIVGDTNWNKAPILAFAPSMTQDDVEPIFLDAKGREVSTGYLKLRGQGWNFLATYHVLDKFNLIRANM